jgi:hypothetical protein
MIKVRTRASFIWSVANFLRDDYATGPIDVRIAD